MRYNKTTNTLCCMFTIAYLSSCTSNYKSDQAYYQAQQNVGLAQVKLAQKPTTIVECTSGCSVKTFDPSKVKFSSIKQADNFYTVLKPITEQASSLFTTIGLTFVGIRAAKEIMRNTGSGNTTTTNHIVSTGDDNPINLRQNTNEGSLNNSLGVDLDNITNNASNSNDNTNNDNNTNTSSNVSSNTGSSSITSQQELN